MVISFSYIALCLGALVAVYLINIGYMSLFYHRAFTHGAIRLRPWFRRFVIATAPWVTGMDIKAWVCMHRMHHKYSDGKRDPHSPVNSNIIGVFKAQLHAYRHVMNRLNEKRKPYASIVSDLDFPVVWFQRKEMWWIPYLAHILIALTIAFVFQAWLLGFALILGSMSHPIQGWIINSFGHSIGYRNFNRDDNSKNNFPAALFILGEGFQNNHHQYPASAKFSAKKWEFDPGYMIVRVLHLFRLIDISRAGLIPRL